MSTQYYAVLAELAAISFFKIGSRDLSFHQPGGAALLLSHLKELKNSFFPATFHEIRRSLQVAVGSIFFIWCDGLNRIVWSLKF
jgi:hypothetical protein